MNKRLRRLPDWIEDIRCAIGNIKEDIKGMSKARFLDDGKSQRAVAKSISDIGESWRLFDGVSGDEPELIRIAPRIQTDLTRGRFPPGV